MGRHLGATPLLPWHADARGNAQWRPCISQRRLIDHPSVGPPEPDHATNPWEDRGAVATNMPPNAHTHQRARTKMHERRFEQRPCVRQRGALSIRWTSTQHGLMLEPKSDWPSTTWGSMTEPNPHARDTRGGVQPCRTLTGMEQVARLAAGGGTSGLRLL